MASAMLYTAATGCDAKRTRTNSTTKNPDDTTGLISETRLKLDFFSLTLRNRVEQIGENENVEGRRGNTRVMGKSER